MIGNKELTYVGHSLGGGLASANALKTGRSAITFNAAALNPNTKHEYNLNQKASIKAFIVQGEALDTMQGLVGMHAEGKKIYLQASYMPMYYCVIFGTAPRIRQRVMNHTCEMLEYLFLKNGIK